MKLKHLLLGTVFLTSTVVSAMPASAAEIYIPLLTYRTGAFAVSGAADCSSRLVAPGSTQRSPA